MVIRIRLMLQSDRLKVMEARSILMPKDNGIRIVITQQVFIIDERGGTSSLNKLQRRYRHMEDRVHNRGEKMFSSMDRK